MICYHSAPTVQSALESIYAHVDEIVIAYGPLADWPFRSDDGTLDLLVDFPDPDKKINLVAAREWPDRKTMRASTAERMTGNYHLMIDSDEVWSDMGPWMEWVAAEQPLSAHAPWITPFRGLKHWVYSMPVPRFRGWGGRPLRCGFGSARRRYHFSKWGPGYYWKTHWRVHTPEGKNLFRCSQLNSTLPTRFWHFGYSLPTRYVREKTQYYQFHCPGLPANHRQNERRKEDAWFGWDGQEGLLTTGTKDDTAVRALPVAEIPPVAERAIARIRTYYDDEDLAFQEKVDAHAPG